MAIFNYPFTLPMINKRLHHITRLKIIASICFIVLSSSNIYAQIDNLGVHEYWNTNKNKSSVSLKEFISIIPREALPPINIPKFLTETGASARYKPNEPFVVVVINKTEKAYPLKILMYHEVINDVIVGKPILITYNPLCNSVAVYHRKLKNHTSSVLTFASSGMLRKANTVLWDWETQSWWQQITGECLVGEMQGTVLEKIPTKVLSYKQFYKNYPFGLMMSDKGEQNIKYGTNPYYKYDDITKDKPLLLTFEPSKRLPPIQRIVNIHINNISLIYPLDILQKSHVFNDKPLDNAIVIFYKEGLPSLLDEEYILESKDVGMLAVYSSNVYGQMLSFIQTNKAIKDKETNSTWDFTGRCVQGRLKGTQLKPLHHDLHFAFAALAFYPNSLIFDEVY